MRKKLASFEKALASFFNSKNEISKFFRKNYWKLTTTFHDQEIELKAVISAGLSTSPIEIHNHFHILLDLLKSFILLKAYENEDRLFTPEDIKEIASTMCEMLLLDASTNAALLKDATLLNRFGRILNELFSSILTSGSGESETTSSDWQLYGLDSPSKAHSNFSDQEVQNIRDGQLSRKENDLQADINNHKFSKSLNNSENPPIWGSTLGQLIKSLEVYSDSGIPLIPGGSWTEAMPSVHFMNIYNKIRILSWE